MERNEGWYTCTGWATTRIFSNARSESGRTGVARMRPAVSAADAEESAGVRIAALLESKNAAANAGQHTQMPKTIADKRNEKSFDPVPRGSPNSRNDITAVGLLALLKSGRPSHPAARNSGLAWLDIRQISAGVGLQWRVRSRF
jgi:hypothetical protein